MVEYLTTNTELAAIANAIRTKIGSSATLVYPNGFIAAIQNINSGTLTVTTSSDANTNIDCDGYENVNITGINLTVPESGTNSFSIKVPNGNSTLTFVFNVDSSGNVTVTES